MQICSCVLNLEMYLTAKIDGNQNFQFIKAKQLNNKNKVSAVLVNFLFIFTNFATKTTFGDLFRRAQLNTTLF